MSESVAKTAASPASHRNFYAVKKLVSGFADLRRSLPANETQLIRDVDAFARSFKDLIELRFPELSELTRFIQ